MSYQNILYEKEGKIGWITVNRPEVRNALNAETLEDILAALAEARNDEDVRVVIFTGAGDKAFVAGADIRILVERTALDGLPSGFTEIFEKIEDFEKPTIAAVNGFAMGGGCELAMCCDLRVASETAKFGLPEVNLGIIPAGGGTQRLRNFVGVGRAKEMIYTGAVIDAREAERFGLVNKVVPAGELRAAATELANKIIEKAPLAVQMAKKSIHTGIRGGPVAGLAFEKHVQAILFGTEDKKEGTSAFLEKRKPQWKGR
ncbi:MAG TPA: enoyl-CoA hydratase-related protein [bacterium]|nr:enoyl-CoA hydratase-related protein [bacterium]